MRDQEDGISDFEEAEAKELEPIESTAPNRVFVEATPIAKSEQTNDRLG